MVRRWHWIVLCTVVAFGAVAAVWLSWPSHSGRTLPPLRERVYSSKRACLLTGSQGLAQKGAQPIWAGMERASVAHRIQVSYLAVQGEQSVDNASTYVATLAQQRCGVIIAIGSPQAVAVTSDVSKFDGIRFAVVGEQKVAGGITALPISPDSAAQNAADLLVSTLDG